MYESVACDRFSIRKFLHAMVANKLTVMRQFFKACFYSCLVHAESSHDGA